MIETVWFMGKEITETERVLLEKVFKEKIDDLELCKAILTVSMQPEYVLERGAFARALKHGYCGYQDGARAAVDLIRMMRKKLGYRFRFTHWVAGLFDRWV